MDAIEILNGLKVEDKKNIYYTLAELRPDDPRSDQVRYVVISVHEFENDICRAEIMSTKILEKYIVWNVDKTLVKIQTKHDTYLGNLVDFIRDEEKNKDLYARLDIF